MGDEMWSSKQRWLSDERDKHHLLPHNILTLDIHRCGYIPVCHCCEPCWPPPSPGLWHWQRRPVQTADSALWSRRLGTPTGKVVQANVATHHIEYNVITHTSLISLIRVVSLSDSTYSFSTSSDSSPSRIGDTLLHKSRGLNSSSKYWCSCWSSNGTYWSTLWYT